MLTDKQKQLLENKIYNILKESMFENDFMENFFQEKKEKKHNKKSDEHKGEKKLGSKRASVMKWLDSAQQLHSTLSYRLWPDMDEDEARSLFSKKYRGHDADGNNYDFDDDDIVKLFNMKDRFLDDIS